MEYHKERFLDFSLMVFDNDKLLAVLPANRVSNTVYSHQGLTYGGLVLAPKVKFKQVAAAFKMILKFLNENKIETLELKQLPAMYCSQPSEELDYLLFLVEAKLTGVDLSSTIYDLETVKICSSGRKDGFRKGRNHQLQIKKTKDFSRFWKEILIPQLKSIHGVKPVHSLEEIQYLQNKFPENILQYNVLFQDKVVGGTTIFKTKNVVHTQYISANTDRQKLGTLDYLFFFLIQEEFKHEKYLDFGISTTHRGKSLNQGLLYWKESLAGKTQVHRFFEIQTKQYSLIDRIL